MFDTTKSLKAVRTIKSGGRAELSYSQIINLIINMMSVMRQLPTEQKNEISDRYDYYRRMKQKKMLDFDGYCEVCWEIISDLDSIAPYDLYCGDVDIELEILHKIRSTRNSSASSVEPELEEYLVDEDTIDETESFETNIVEEPQSNSGYRTSRDIVIARIKKYLEEEDIKYDFDEEDDEFYVRFAGDEVFEILYAKFCVLEYGFRYELLTDYEYKGENSGELSKYLLAKNFLRNRPGAFMYNFYNGFIGFSEFVDFSDCEPSNAVMHDCMVIAENAVLGIRDDILKITSAAKTAEDILVD